MRRNIPGPAGGAYRSVVTAASDEHSQGEEGAALPSSLFDKKSWLSLCRALDIAAVASDDAEQWASAIKSVLPCTIADVLSGACDMRVPKLAAVVAGVRHSPNSDVILQLADPTGRIDAYLHPDITGVPVAHSAVFLEQVAIVIANVVDIERVLNIHPRCLVTVIPDEIEAHTETSLQTDEL